MKETLNVNIGCVAFTIDRDAYESLGQYLDNIASRLPEEDTETLDDIERRIGELLRDEVRTPMRVVGIEAVHAAMSQIGAPEEFGNRRDADTSAESPEPEEPRRLYRSRTDRSIAGVCGGIAEFFGADPTLVRILTLLLLLFGGVSIWLYIVLWIVVPEEPRRRFQIDNNKNR